MPDKNAALRWSFLLSLLVVILSAMAMRLWVNFSSPLPPGTDAAYYPLQARALLEDGRLAYSDLPLIFAADALLAKLCRLVGGMGVDDSVLLATRVVDGVAQPFLAVALFALGWAWARGVSGKRAGVSLALGLGAAAMLSTVSLPMLRMTGDYQKNSLGLVWLAGFAWTLHASLSVGNWWRWTLAGLAVILAGLTHVAAFGASLVLGAATVTVYWAIVRKLTWRSIAGVLVGGLFVAVLALACVLLASPRRGLALLAAPLELFKSDPIAPRAALLGKLVSGAVYAILVWGGWTLWRERKTVSPAQFALVAGAGLCAALLACPLLNEEFFKRLVLMSPVPASIVLVHVMTLRALRNRRAWPALLVGGMSLLSVAAALSGGIFSRGIMSTVITVEGARELRSMGSLVDDPTRTVVLARKGLMWWAGFLMRVPVREDRVPPDSIAKYARVLVLTEKNTPESGGGPQRKRPRGGRESGGWLIYDGEHYRLSEVRTLRE